MSPYALIVAVPVSTVNRSLHPSAPHAAEPQTFDPGRPAGSLENCNSTRSADN